MGGYLMPYSYVFGINGLTNVILLSIIILIETIVKKVECEWCKLPVTTTPTLPKSPKNLNPYLPSKNYLK